MGWYCSALDADTTAAADDDDDADATADSDDADTTADDNDAGNCVIWLTSTESSRPKHQCMSDLLEDKSEL